MSSIASRSDGADARDSPHGKATAAAKVESTSSLVKDVSNDVAVREDPVHPQGIQMLLIMVALCLAVFCMALDNTIITTATPRITDEFKSLQDIGWYGSAYLLTTCAFQLFYGKLYSLFNIKLVFLAALLIFEVGSAVCGAAPSSTAFIVGRAVAGLGAAGLFSGSLIIIAHSSPVVKRPIYTGVLGMGYGLASVLGPLIGGAFTDRVTWRWCFYINLPLGAVTAVIIVPFLKLKSTQSAKRDMSMFQTFWSLDPLGTFLFVPSIVSLLLALQWAGTTYAWNSARIIALLTVFAVLLVMFFGVQVWLGEGATIPLRIAAQRTVAFASLFSFLIGAAFFLLMYFIPVWFQAVMGTDALTSGIHNIPLILSLTIAIIISGGLTTKLGHYMPFVYACVVLTSIGAGLITTFSLNTTEGQWIGFQILYGFGCGLAFQIPQIAAQTVLPPADVAIGVSITFFAQIFGGAVFVSAGNNIFNSRLVENLEGLHIPSVDPRHVVELGATQLRSYVPAQYVGQAVQAYNEALVKTFQVVLIVSCLSVLGAVGMEWKSVKAPYDGDPQQDTEDSREKA